MWLVVCFKLVNTVIFWKSYAIQKKTFVFASVDPVLTTGTMLC